MKAASTWAILFAAQLAVAEEAPKAAAAGAPPPAEEPEHAIQFSGYANLGAGYTTPDPNAYYVGRNNGFRLLAVRLEAEGRPVGRFGFVVSLDGAVDRRSDATSLLGRKGVELKDALLTFDAHKLLTIKAGQYKAPYGAESLQGDGDLPFVVRSVVSRGVTAPEGREVEGMSLERQVGVGLRVGSLRDEGLGAAFEAGVFNGNGANQLLNDNNLPMVVGRLEGWLGTQVSVGLSAYWDPRTIPDERSGTLYDEARLAAGVDVTANLGPFQVLAMALGRQTQFVTTGAPSALAFGLMGQAVYTLPRFLAGLQIGYRFARYEPSDRIAGDIVSEHDLLLAYPFPDIPLRVAVQVELRGEQADNQLDNSGVDLLLQAHF